MILYEFNKEVTIFQGNYYIIFNDNGGDSLFILLLIIIILKNELTLNGSSLFNNY